MGTEEEADELNVEGRFLWGLAVDGGLRFRIKSARGLRFSDLTFPGLLVLANGTKERARGLLTWKHVSLCLRDMGINKRHESKGLG